MGRLRNVEFRRVYEISSSRDAEFREDGQFTRRGVHTMLSLRDGKVRSWGFHKMRSRRYEVQGIES